MSNMLEKDVTDRRHQILDAAFRTFITYGFRRTTMADIAKAAGLSRPALYLEFKNKTDIYRAKFLAMLDETLADFDRALDGGEPLAGRIANAILAGTIAPFGAILGTPHGAEIFDVKQEIAADLGDLWFVRMEERLALAIGRAAAGGEIDLDRAGGDAATLARLLVAAIEGVKSRMTDLVAAERDVRQLVALMIGPLACSRRSDCPEG